MDNKENEIREDKSIEVKFVPVGDAIKLELSVPEEKSDIVEIKED